MFTLMLQCWHEITFCHWSCDPALLRSHVPPQLQVDTFEGKAWISLTPFLLTGLRPPLFPHKLGMVFPEMNLRTYVIGPRGPAIWFFSLDAARLLPVIGARAGFGLPYFWADMNVEIHTGENVYLSDRRGRARAAIRIGKQDPIHTQSPLDIFLTARFRLYSLRRGRLITAQVAHPPWQLNSARIIELEENVRHAMGVEFPSTDFRVHHSSGVDTRIGRPVDCTNEQPQSGARK